jgi:cytochrome c peroxidase
MSRFRPLVVCLFLLCRSFAPAHAGVQTWEPECEAGASCAPKELVALGRALFVSEAVSPRRRSCASCHEPDHGYGASRATRDKFRHLPRSIPSLLNLAHQRWFFWDGRADRLWQQALGPLESAAEMDSHRMFMVNAVLADDRLRLLALAASDSVGRAEISQARAQVGAGMLAKCDGTVSCKRRWQELPADGRIVIDSVARRLFFALEAFQLTLKSRRTAYDEYLASGHGLSRQELRGMKLFFGEARCSSCHSGPALSDAGFHNLLLPSPSGREKEDPGRFRGIQHLRSLAASGDLAYKPTEIATHLDLNNSVWGQFKTPSIRNLEGRAEYMHNGVFQTLRDLLRYYNTLAEAQVVHHHPNALLTPLQFGNDQLDDLEAFLNVFTNRRN